MADGQMTPDDLLLAVDAALLQLTVLRGMVERYTGSPVHPDDGECKHLRQMDMMGGAVYCQDCGVLLSGSEHGVSEESPAGL